MSNEDDWENTPGYAMTGRTCSGTCPIHGEPCNIVMEYDEPQVQALVDALKRLTEGHMDHDEEGEEHYCDLCSKAMREGRERDFYRRDPDGVVRTKYAPRRDG